MKSFLARSLGWSTKITVFTVLLASIFSSISTFVLANSSILLGITIVLFFITFGIVSDTIGLSAAAAKESPFHSMASKRINGAKESVQICKNAEVFSSFFNDVVGDICGIVSGSASAAVVLQISLMASQSEDSLYYSITAILFTSVVAGLTVGGKALCKEIAIRGSTKVIFFMGKTIYLLENKLSIHILSLVKKL
ncbi:hypothetical protein DXT76_20005 [Halobacillus trueperi]|uniref:CNNM transmembrane domain-containing protein n=1 Tax=Halobacillus trueperi TaxID=156205 RepID=A0A3D8VBY0_9BACI|nr:hypothetical protein [Halobacillus trueperi]RDY66944.1 hypothetical protein DXT76_20005 [Halobacillus trueperi]